MEKVVNYLVWGAVQGLTEFLPVSSSAHLVFLSKVLSFDGDNSLLFFTSLHMGTLLALLFFFRKRLLDVMASISSNWSFLISIGIATFISGMVAFGLKDLADLLTQQVRYTAGILNSMGVFLLVSSFLPAGVKNERDFHWGIAILFGLVQGLAVFPGISRSGSTILLLLSLGFKPDSAFNISFLAGIPIILLAFIYELLKHGGTFSPWYCLGMCFAFLFGLLGLVFLRITVIKGRLYWFGVYCIVVSTLVCFLFRD